MKSRFFSAEITFLTVLCYTLVMIQVPKKQKQTAVKKPAAKPAESSSSSDSDSGVEAGTKKTTPAVPAAKTAPQKKKQPADDSSSSASESEEPVVTKPIRSKQGNSNSLHSQVFLFSIIQIFSFFWGFCISVFLALSPCIQGRQNIIFRLY